MDRLDPEGAAARALALPAPGPGREVPGVPVVADEHDRAHELAEAAGPDGRAERERLGREPVLEHDAHWHPGGVAPRHDLPSLVRVPPDGLLDQDRHAVRGGQPRERRVRVIRRDHAGGVHVVARERGLRRVGRVGAVRPGQPASAREVGIDHRDQPRPRQGRQRLGVRRGASARPQQHEPDRPGGERSHGAAAPGRRRAIRIDRHPQEVSS